MRLAMRLPGKSSDKNGDGSESSLAENADPREQESAEIIDLASRTAYPAVTSGKGKSDGFGLAAGVAFVGLLGAVSFWGMNSARLAEPETVGAQPAAAAPQATATGAAAPIKAAVVKPKLPGATNPVVRSNPAPSPVLARMPGTNVSAVPRANPYNSPMLVFDAGAGVGSAAPGLAIPAPVGGAGNTPANTRGGPVGSAAAFASSIGGVGGGTAEAQAMVNPSTTVTEGTLIPAVLETAINTDVPGYVRAVVSQDVRSFDGTKVLIPRSSRVIGQYQSGVQGGQKRAYVIWTRLIRPDGASIAIASPGVGYDGTTGIAGDVDTHFFSRFGSAMLLSVVGGLGAIASGGASVVIGGAGQSAASTALQQDGQRGPTIRVRQGEPIRIFTARDLGFSGV